MTLSTVKDLQLLVKRVKKQFTNYRSVGVEDIDYNIDQFKTLKADLQKIQQQRKYVKKNKPVIYKENKEFISKHISVLNKLLKSLNVYFKNKKSRIKHFEAYLEIIKDLFEDEEFKLKIKNAKIQFDKELPKEIQQFKKLSYLNYKHYRAMGYSVTKIKKEDERIQKLLKEI